MYPTMKNPPADLIKKMKTDRIFASLFYPNTLAAVVLLYLPMFAGLLYRLRSVIRRSLCLALWGLFAIAGCGCLLWSGSKSGWLIFLCLGLIAIFHCRLSARIKISVVTVLCVAGLAGFFIRYKTFFDRGATSVSARFDYWEGALKIGWSHPIFGTGPGTFGKMYRLVRPPESEPAKLTHNDYLEQWCDSGIVGFLAYFVFIAASLSLLYRKSGRVLESLDFWIWLGLLGVALHCLVEFHLYIPALAWPLFFLLGRQSSVGSISTIDKLPALP